MMKTAAAIQRFLLDEDGPTAVEYATLLALILAVVIGAITAVGNSTSSLWQDDATRIQDALRPGP